ncbi:MAG: DUF4159 domain-containing protein [bacterium]
MKKNKFLLLAPLEVFLKGTVQFFNKRSRIIVGFLMGLTALLANLLFAYGDKFQFCVIKHGGFYNPHPTSYENALRFITSTTSIDPDGEAAEVEVGKDIFGYPFLYLTAKGSLPDFTKEEIGFFSRHLNSGGLLLIDEAENFGLEDFYVSVSVFAGQIFPGSVLEKIPQEDVIFKSFYLKPKVAGRCDVSPYLYGVKKDGRWLIIYSRNDLMGAWAKDTLVRFLYRCLPGGEPQRMEAVKLTVNLIMYSLTGSYKQDIIHKEFIERKLKSW